MLIYSYLTKNMSKYWLVFNGCEILTVKLISTKQ
jgi:hypothetical protein